MKIIAVGMNYVAHCHELHADEKLPEEPVIFMKPDSALLKDSKPFFIPDFSQQVDYETELVVRINRLGKNIAPRFASRYYLSLIHISEPTRQAEISYAVFCLKKKKKKNQSYYLTSKTTGLNLTV